MRDANTRLASVATDALDKSGGAMLEAIVTGEQGPPRPAAWGRLQGMRGSCTRRCWAA